MGSCFADEYGLGIEITRCKNIGDHGEVRELKHILIDGELSLIQKI